MDFWRIAGILGKRKWLILLSVLVSVLLTAGVANLVGSKWTATVQFVSPQNSTLVSDSASPGGSGDGAADQGVESARQQANIYDAIVKSRDVLEPSLRTLDMTKVPEDMLKDIEFKAIAPRLYQLNVKDASPERAGKLANLLAENFVKVFHRVRTEQVKNTVDLLEQQLQKSDEKLAQARARYDSFRTSHHIVGSLSAELDGALQRQRDARQKVDETNLKIEEGQARLSKLEQEISGSPATVTVAVPAGGSSTSVTNLPPDELRKQLDAADQKLKALQQKYQDTTPVVKAAQADRDALAAQIAARITPKPQSNAKEESTVHEMPNPVLAPMRDEANKLTQEVAGEKAMLGSLNANVVAAQSVIDQFKGIDSPLSAMANEVAVLSENRNNLAARVRNARVLRDATESQTPITIMDKVNEFNPPVNALAGRTSKLLILAAIAGLLVACGIVIGLDTVDRRVRTVKEAEIVLPAPVLAAIPQPMGEVTYSTLARATEMHPQSLHSEAYRFIGLHLLNQTNKDSTKVRSLMFLSAKAEQGSTTTLTNLGISLAQAGKKVILVDANIRTAELHQVFDLPNQFGYMDLLQNSSNADVDRALRSTSVPNLQVITSGRQPANPWEAFRSQGIKDVSDRLHERADYILYDTPSSILFTDALNLAPVVDASFLCVRALEPVTGAEDRLVKLLAEADVPVLGCVLTDVPASVVEGYHNYQHYYRPAANTEVVANGQAAARLTAGSQTVAQPWLDIPVETPVADPSPSDTAG